MAGEILINSASNIGSYTIDITPMFHQIADSFMFSVIQLLSKRCRIVDVKWHE